MQRFYIVTHGCRINQYESQSLRESWLQQGLTETDRPERAEVFLLNSCAVTARAVQDLRKTIRKLHRTSREAKIIVTGCAAGPYAGQIRELPGVHSVIPQEDKPWLGKQGPEPRAGQTERQPMEQGEHFPGFSITNFQRVRPVLKVQDGCSQGCAYCIVPLTRGPSRSRNPEEILQEASRIADSGFPELVISGINLGQYRAGAAPSMDFWDLLRFLDQRLRERYENGPRLRLSSLDPSLLTGKGLRVLSEAGLVCPHLHLSVQSGSKTILRSMGRTHYTPATIAEFIDGLGAIWPKFGLGADFLLGFPGETEAEFAQTLRLCQRLPFSYGHVFPYSARPGTRAMQFSQPAPDTGVNRERSTALRRLLAHKKRSFLQSLCTLKSMEVVLEQTDPARGINEYFTSCVFESEPPGREKGDTIRARPLRSTAQSLVVKQV